jgi:DNA-binding YbaB/EbfC family protein
VTMEGAGGSGPDLGALLSQLGQVQQNLQAAQASATSQVVEGTAGGGAVKIVGTGGLDVRAVVIDPSVVDPADIDMLQDLVLAAVRDLVERAQALQAEALGGIDIGGGIEGLLGS